MTSRHVPPSRRRYEAANPTIAARIDRALYLALSDIADFSARSLGEVIRDALNEYVDPEPPESEDDVVAEPTHGPEAHPEFVELTAEVERLRSARWQLQLDLDYARGQLSDLARLKDKAEKAEATLAQIGGPLGLYLRCIHCSRAWHEHKWTRAHRTWSCPKD